MTFRQKIIAALALVATVALFTGFATFPEWRAFVLQLVGMA